jgi:drug/metabolite transporter (DMT)-like permease
MWAGVAVITAAMVIVAIVPFLGTSDTSAGGGKNPMIGVMLVLTGCLAQGVQYVFEEKVMAVDNVPPLVVIGFEGIWGTLLTIFIVYPIASKIPGYDEGGVFENPHDAIKMIAHSALLQVYHYSL